MVSDFSYWRVLSNHVKKVDVSMIFGQVIGDIGKKVQNAQSTHKSSLRVSYKRLYLLNVLS